MDIHSVFVLKRRICAFPGCNTTSAASQLEVAGLDPCGTKAIKEVRLTRYGALVEVGIAEFTYVDLLELVEA